MGSLFSGPDTPTPPPPPAPPDPNMMETQKQLAAAAEAQRQRVQGGRASTIMTGANGLDSNQYAQGVSRQTLLGT